MVNDMRTNRGYYIEERHQQEIKQIAESLQVSQNDVINALLAKSLELRRSGRFALSRKPTRFRIFSD